MIVDFINGKNPAYINCAMNLIDVEDVALGHILAAERGRIGERYILGGETVRMTQLLGMITDLTGLAMPRTRVPYLLALGVAGISEWIADHISGKSPKAPLAGVQIAGASGTCSSSKAVRELGLKPRPVHKALQNEIAWLYDQGLIRQPLALAKAASFAMLPLPPHGHDTAPCRARRGRCRTADDGFRGFKNNSTNAAVERTQLAIVRQPWPSSGRGM